MAARETIKQQNLTPEELKQFRSDFPNCTIPEPALYGNNKFCLPKDLDVDYIRNDMVVYPDDLWIVTPPKCGTTWMQEIVWLINTDVDVSKSQCHQFYRVPFLELGTIIPEEHRLPKPDFEKEEQTYENILKFMANSFEYVLSLKRPRIIKTHLPLELLPKSLLDTSKVIYCGRNAKDACVSWYHHQRIQGFNGTFEEMAKVYKAGKQFYQPIVPHVVGAWKCKGHANLYFTMYEEMKKDLAPVILQIAAFMGKKLSNAQVETILKEVDIESFRKNKFVNKSKEVGSKFIRKGIVGDWQNYFTPEMNVEWNTWIEDGLRGSSLNMVFG